jgi:hypothetical protein
MMSLPKTLRTAHFARARGRIIALIRDLELFSHSTAFWQFSKSHRVQTPIRSGHWPLRPSGQVPTFHLPCGSSAWEPSRSPVALDRVLVLWLPCGQFTSTPKISQLFWKDFNKRVDVIVIPLYIKRVDVNNTRLQREKTMDHREERGMMIAATSNHIRRKSGNLWTVPSSQGTGHPCYHVNPEKKTCTCLDHQEAGHYCKHLYAVKFVIQREFEFNDDGSVTEIETLAAIQQTRKTYPQNWRAYDAAQINEKSKFQTLLHDLCKGINEQPHTGRGRPPIPLADAIYCAVFKVYSTVSSRRCISDIADAKAKGYISRTPCYASILHIFESAATTPILEQLVIETANPLKAIETKFAIDSSGFSGSRFDRWFDHKWGQHKSMRVWTKAHIMCGTTTNVITACEISDAGDAPTLPKLLTATASRFNMEQLSADMGYSAEYNIQAIQEVGALPLIPFKSNATGASKGTIWSKAFHYFQFKRDEFLKRYHNRSNVESTFSMLKAKFGDSVRSKTDTAMKNEVLAKIVCHNICCLISAMYELGIDPIFYSEKPVDKQFA